MSPTTAVTAVGLSGTVEGVTAADAADAADVPIPLVAVTLNVYGEPFVSPVISQLCVGATVVQLPEATLFDEYAVTVYPFISEPRISIGASHLTVAVVLPFSAIAFKGTEGAALIDVLPEAVDADEVPAKLVAVTVNV